MMPLSGVYIRMTRLGNSAVTAVNTAINRALSRSIRATLFFSETISRLPQ
mgnify:CR=1 FL=1